MKWDNSYVHERAPRGRHPVTRTFLTTVMTNDQPSVHFMSRPPFLTPSAICLFLILRRSISNSGMELCCTSALVTLRSRSSWGLYFFIDVQAEQPSHLTWLLCESVDKWWWWWWWGVTMETRDCNPEAAVQYHSLSVNAIPSALCRRSPSVIRVNTSLASQLP